MSRLACAVVVTILVGVCSSAGRAAAQQVTATVPYHGTSDNFFERTGVHWGLQGKGWSFSFGGAPMAPIAGAIAPGGGVQGGFRFGQPGRGGFFGLTAEQGAGRSLVGGSPALTTINGLPGVVSDVTFSPFVIGTYPVVGGFPDSLFMASPGFCPSTLYAPTYPLSRLSELPGSPPANTGLVPANKVVVDRNAAGGAARRLAEVKDSTGRTAPSVAEARRRYAEDQAAQDREGQQWFDRAIEAERSGNKGAARVYYQMAARRLTGDLKDRALARLASLK
jgi:hypothetical protein